MIRWSRDPAYLLVSVLGLAAGLGFCLLLLAYSRHAWTYDSHVPDVDQVYVIKHRRNWELGKPWTDQVPLAMREPARALPGVADVSGFANWFPLNLERNGSLVPIHSLTALPGFAKMMGLRATQGDLETTLESPDAVALTEDGARRLFGTTSVLGRTLALRLDAADTNSGVARVGAILPSPPANTTIPFEMLHGVNLAMLPSWAREEALGGGMGFSGGYLLLRLAPGASVADVTSKLQSLADHSPLAALVPEPVKAHAGRDKFTEVKLSPLGEAYLDDEVSQNVFSRDVPRGDARSIAGLTAVALLLLTLAGVNYVNFAVMRLLRREREISLRKVLGANPRRLARRLFAESLLVSLAATGLGVLFAALALPAFGRLVDRDLQDVLSPENLLAALSLGLLAGLLTAIYPAWIAWRVHPARLLAGRGDAESASGRRLRRFFSVAQLALATGLAGVTLAVALQTRYAMNAPLGFEADPLLVARLPIGMSAQYTDQARALREALSQHPAVASVAVSNDTLGQTREVWSTDFRRADGQLLFIEVKGVSQNFFATHGIAPVAGRLFADTDSDEQASAPLVLNEAAAALLGFPRASAAVGQRIQVRGMQMEMQGHAVVGIAPNVRLRSLRDRPGPVVYMVSNVGSVLTVRARDSIVAAERAMRALWPRFLPNAVVDIRRARDLFSESYEDDARLARLLALCTLVAMLIAAGGAFVLATDTVKRRTREIALRKMFGARPRHVGAVMAREMGTLLLVAAAIGLPVAALCIARYLAAFTDHAPWAYAALAAALAMTGAMLAIGAARQTILAMRTRAAAALRAPL